MTIIEAINRIDVLKPNGYKQAEKVAWLSAFDGDVKMNIIDTHEGGGSVRFSGYGEDTPLTTDLLISAPYDEVYLFLLEAKIDYYDREFEKYNNAMAMFNTAYAEYEAYYNRAHMPAGKKCFLF